MSISRVQAAYTFPASFLLCASRNPCPCGWLGDNKHQCTCRPGEIERYQRKVSGPLLDRIDIQVHVPRVEFKDLRTKAPGEKSAVIRERVCAARQIQLQRLQPAGLYCNAQMSHREVERFCQLDAPSMALLEQVFAALGLSARSYDRIIKVARTIADLAGGGAITTAHVAEAIQLRTSTQK